MIRNVKRYTYEKTHYRDSDGRYVVCIPTNPELTQTQKLGESRNKAIARLRQLESKFTTNEKLKKEYTSFMMQFIDLGHMVEVLPSDKPQAQKCYMPHHAVHKPDSTTTKLRIVFDGFVKTSTGVSLNNLMLVGP